MGFLMFKKMVCEPIYHQWGMAIPQYASVIQLLTMAQLGLLEIDGTTTGLKMMW
jgi:hypothetical protein